MKRRDILRRGSVVLVLGAHQIASGAGILAVRVWPASDYTRVTIESDTLLPSRQMVVLSPPRLAVDIEGLQLDASLRELVAKVRSEDPFIAGIRVGQLAPGIVRLVVDLKQQAIPQVFNLPPVAAYQHRLVIDFHPLKPIDPLEALIAERTRDNAQRAAPAPSTDALDELIARHAEPRSTRTPLPAPATATPGAGAPGSTPATAPSAPVVASKVDRLIIVALDPGHGGEDPGAIGPGGTREKDVVLQIAQRLRERINATTINGNPMRAFMTRDADFFVPLHARVQKARRVQADLFVSIHADAWKEPTARGASVFALSQNGATSAAARWMADKENRADSVGGVNIRKQDSQVLQSMLDMSTTAQISDSLKLGGAVLGEIRGVGRLHKPRVEQAGFAVLKAPDIPSVLVETAFISNPEEEIRLKSQEYQDQLADAIMRGISRYFSKNPPLARNRAV